MTDHSDDRIVRQRLLNNEINNWEINNWFTLLKSFSLSEPVPATMVPWKTNEGTAIG
jgi:hypothetical protein